MSNDTVVVLGCGEVGESIAKILDRQQDVDVVRLDTAHEDYYEQFQRAMSSEVLAIHVCIPGDLKNLPNKIVRPIERLQPSMVLIHSTVPPGTCEAVWEETQVALCHAQIHAKHTTHAGMAESILHGAPMLIGCHESYVMRFGEYLLGLGFKEVMWVGETVTSEVGKLLATTLYANLIAFHQAAERACRATGADLGGARKIWTDYYFPDFDVSKIYPGLIGGHCCMPNLEILKKAAPDEMWDAIQVSNSKKELEQLSEART